MKFKKNIKKGFTLVELIVVIAIVAILAAVSVVSYIAFINSANESADIQLVKQLNIALQADQALYDVRSTPTEMLEAMEENGFVIENLTKTKSGYDIVWDQKNNRFALLKGEEPIYAESSFNNTTPLSRSQITKLVDNSSEASDATENHYSIYLTKEFGDAESLNVSSGLDVGNNVIGTINYVNDVNHPQSVVIRTNSANTQLNVNASADTVHHYGNLGKLNLTEVAYDCFYEHGKTAFAEASKGKIVVKEGGEIKVLFAQAALVAAKTDGGLIENAYCISNSTAEALETGYTNFSNSKQGNVIFAYVDENLNPITTAIIEEKQNEAIDKLAGEQVEEDPEIEYFVARIGTKGYSSFQDAYDKAVSGNKIVLLKNIVLSEVIEGNFIQEYCASGFNFNKAGITLDLNGNSLTCTSKNNDYMYAFYVAPGADLTIKDSVGGGLISAPNAETVFSVYGILNIYGGTIKAEYISDPISDPYYGTYTFGSSAVRTERWNKTSYGTANIYGGKLIASTGATYNNYGLNNCGEANIYGGSFESNAYNNAACGIGNSAVLNIKNDIELYSFYWNNRNDNINSSVVNVDSGKAFVVDYLTIENYSDYPSMSINGNASYKTNDFSQGNTFEYALGAAKNYDYVKYFVNYSEE